MDRRDFHRLLLGSAAASAPVPLLAPPRTAYAAGPGQAAGTAGAAGRPSPCRRSLVEHELPVDEQTHEMVKVPGRPMVLVSQMGGSRLVKLRLDPRTERFTAQRRFPLGPPDSRLHGLTASSRYPGRIWATHEGGDRLLLVDPRAHSVDAAPRVERVIDVPGGGHGPHYVGEYGDMLWVTLKGSEQVLALNHTAPRRYRLYDAEPKPIFAARHPAGGDFYVSQDAASTLLRIDPRTGRTRQIPVPAHLGSTPVGLVGGAGALWVVLLGTAEAGTGTFGRIDAHGRIVWHRLRDPLVRSAGLLHAAFDPPGTGRPPGLWLLGSSIISPHVQDVIVRVHFDPSYTRVLGEEAVALPTQQCKAHRLLPLRRSVLASELTASRIAQLTDAAGCGPRAGSPAG